MSKPFDDDTVNHILLIQKLCDFTGDSPLSKVIQNILSCRRLYVELYNDRSRWRNQKNGLRQGSVLSPILFNTYTTTRHFTMEHGTLSMQMNYVSQRTYHKKGTG